ncbi:potassium-transporting ATPase subunit C [Calothrix sp. HK-06]|nr:potassium-transporting ATPase subunit C [Calothrix sp. HK-06]
MIMLQNILKAIRISVILWLITGIVYPLLIFGVGQLPMLHEKANGTIVYNLDDKPYGSSLIGQVFTSERYFHTRPSAVRYSQGKQGRPTGVSGASNLAPSNPDLLKRVVDTANQLRDESVSPLGDFIYTSASGLDPHISLRAASAQLDRVAKARGIRPEEVIPLINRSTDNRFLGIFGEPGVNVLRLNYTLDLNERVSNQRRNQ